MTELEIKDLLFRASRPWRFGKFKRDVLALCDQALGYEVNMDLSAKKLVESRMETECLKQRITQLEAACHSSNRALAVALESVRRTRKADNGVVLPDIFKRR